MEVDVKYTEWIDFERMAHQECTVTTVIGGQMIRFSRFGDSRKEALTKVIADMERMKEDLWMAISMARVELE